nr:ekc/keops complex subunit [Quercus suber]
MDFEIAESFRRFGIANDSTNVLAVKVSNNADQVFQHLQQHVEGTVVPFTNSSLSDMRDVAKLRKYYKLEATKKGEQDSGLGKEAEAFVLGSMALKAGVDAHPSTGLAYLLKCRDTSPGFCFRPILLAHLTQDYVLHERASSLVHPIKTDTALRFCGYPQHSSSSAPRPYLWRHQQKGDRFADYRPERRWHSDDESQYTACSVPSQEHNARWLCLVSEPPLSFR